MEVDESRTCELDLRNHVARGNCVGQRLRELTRIASRWLRKLQSDVRSEIAMRRIARTLDADRRLADIRWKNVWRQRRQSGGHKLLDLVFQDG